MKKLSLLLTLFTLLACRSPQEATQTIIRIRATDAMKERIKSVTTQIIALPKSAIASSEGPETPSWPMKWTIVPESASASHRFNFIFTGTDDAGALVTQLEIQAEVVEGASRYLYILLSDDCLTDHCDGGVCRAVVGAAALRTSAEQAAELESGCMGGSIAQPPAAMAGAGEAGSGEGDSGDRQMPPTGQNQTITGAATMAGAPAANDGSNVPVGSATQPDGGKVAVPSSDAECRNNPCAPHGTCSLNSAAPKKYECNCEVGFEPDATGATCVTRNDCNKDNGGCEDRCEPNSVGEAVCSCTRANTWPKADAKQCATAQPEQALSTSGGSVDRTRPQVAFDPQGNGVVAWTETSDSGVHSLWTARYDASTKAWQLPSEPFQRYATEAADLHLALDSQGSGLLIWTATVQTRRQLWAARYTNNAFSSPHRVDNGSEGDALMPSLALDTVGDGLVVWTDLVYPRSALRVSRYNASSDTFTAMETYGDSTDNFVFGTSVSLNNASSGLIAWTEVPVSTNAEGGVDVQFTSANAKGTRVTAVVRPGETFVNSSYPSSSPDVVIDSQDRGVAVWLQATSPTLDQLSIVSRIYLPGIGWTMQPMQTLSDRGGIWSTPRVVMGPDGSAFTTWREAIGDAAASGTMATTLLTRGALRTADKFGAAFELGLPSDVPNWNDVDPQAWTPETTVTALDGFQPNWTIAMGPGQTGFIAGASFSASSSPATRQLWLQRMAPDQAPSEPIFLSKRDSVPSRPSPVKLGLNANGDGAVVWDHQIDGHYHVFASLLD